MSNPTIKHLGTHLTYSNPSSDEEISILNQSAAQQISWLETTLLNNPLVVFRVDASKSHTLTLDDQGRVYSWESIPSTTGNLMVQSTEANRPLYVAATPNNGLPGLYFDSPSDTSTAAKWLISSGEPGIFSYEKFALIAVCTDMGDSIGNGCVFAYNSAPISSERRMQYLVMRNASNGYRHMRMTRIWQPGAIVDFSDANILPVPRGSTCVGAQIDKGIKTGDGKVFGIFRGVDSQNYSGNQNSRTAGSLNNGSSRFNVGRNQIDIPQTSLQDGYIHECIALYGDEITTSYVDRIIRALEAKWGAESSISASESIL